MDKQLLKAFSALVTGFSIGSGICFAYALILYKKDPYLIGNEAIKTEMYYQLLAGSGMFLTVVFAFVLMKLLARHKYP